MLSLILLSSLQQQIELNDKVCQARSKIEHEDRQFWHQRIKSVGVQSCGFQAHKCNEVFKKIGECIGRVHCKDAKAFMVRGKEFIAKPMHQPSMLPVIKRKPFGKKSVTIALKR